MIMPEIPPLTSAYPVLKPASIKKEDRHPSERPPRKKKPDPDPRQSPPVQHIDEIA
jgi:hypothetical protein